VAPDEAKRLPQLLHDCGYMLVEENDAPSAKGDIQSASYHQQQKKAIPYSSLASQAQKKAVSNPIRTRPQQKRATQPKSKQTQIKKRASSPLKKTPGLSKKTNVGRFLQPP
jgi:hypothetical protein